MKWQLNNATREWERQIWATIVKLSAHTTIRLTKDTKFIIYFSVFKLFFFTSSTNCHDEHMIFYSQYLTQSMFKYTKYSKTYTLIRDWRVLNSEFRIPRMAINMCTKTTCEENQCPPTEAPFVSGEQWFLLLLLFYLLKTVITIGLVLTRCCHSVSITL